MGDGTAGIQTGAAPGARILPVKIFTSAGTATLGRVWAAQQYCVENGCRIISMSLGIKGDIPAAYLRNDRYNADHIRAAGVVLFNSAGNEHDGIDPLYELGMTARIPAPWNSEPVPSTSLSGIITVGASADGSDQIYHASSQGPVGWDQVDPWHDWPYLPGPGLMKPDMVAPGQHICSTLPWPDLYSGATWSGTSMATPLVAGVAALMLEKNPTLSPAGIDSLLERTARDAGAPGKDSVFGAGVIDAYEAVLAVPADLLPDLSSASFLPDPLGNGVLEPSELAGAVFEVQNAGQVAATGVMGKLSIDANHYVSVLENTAEFPDIPAGAKLSNLAMPFRLAVSPLAPHGYEFCMTLRITTDQGYERIFDVKSYLGLPEFRTLDKGELYLSVTSYGSLGYVTDSQVTGVGAGLDGGPSSLFIGSLWAGDSPGYVCNNDLTASGADPLRLGTARGPHRSRGGAQ